MSSTSGSSEPLRCIALRKHCTARYGLLSARCSQELVEKTVRAGIPMLVTISAPSSLAIARAREGRLTLLALARDDSALVITDPHRLF